MDGGWVIVSFPPVFRVTSILGLSGGVGENRFRRVGLTYRNDGSLDIGSGIFF